jgi:hypothetical protein
MSLGEGTTLKVAILVKLEDEAIDLLIAVRQRDTKKIKATARKIAILGKVIT